MCCERSHCCKEKKQYKGLLTWKEVALEKFNMLSYCTSHGTNKREIFVLLGFLLRKFEILSFSCLSPSSSFSPIGPEESQDSPAYTAELSAALLVVAQHLRLRGVSHGFLTARHRQPSSHTFDRCTEGSGRGTRGDCSILGLPARNNRGKSKAQCPEAPDPLRMLLHPTIRQLHSSPSSLDLGLKKKKKRDIMNSSFRSKMLTES